MKDSLMQTIKFRTSHGQLAALEALAEETDRPVSWHVRRAVAMYLQFKKDQEEAVALRSSMDTGISEVPPYFRAVWSKWEPGTDAEAEKE
jgi:predicted DNA-binding protein